MRRIVCALKILGFFLSFMVGIPVVHAQTKAPKPPTQKEQYKAAAKKENQAKKADEKAKKEYRKMQSKDSKKNMRKTKRKSDRIRKSKAEPFWEKWFR